MKGDSAQPTTTVTNARGIDAWIDGYIAAQDDEPPSHFTSLAANEWMKGWDDGVHDLNWMRERHNG